MTSSLEVTLDENATIEIHYECWAEGVSLDYDQPPDPSGHEVQKIELHIGERVIDVTEIADELSSALDYDKISEAVIEHISKR